MKTHTFRTTGEAYDASQCREEIKNGDILVATEEKVVGFLLDAWPVAVTVAYGNFHTKDPKYSWSEMESMRKVDPPNFLNCAVEARAVAASLGFDLPKMD